MAEGQKVCDKCKRFLREDGGCTHCERAGLLSGPLRDVSLVEAEKILSEPVEVTDRRGNKVVFTKEKLIPVGAHLSKDHRFSDYKRRLVKIRYCIEAARSGDAEQREVVNTATNYLKKRTVYTKVFSGKDGQKIKAVAIADDKDSIREVFTIYANG